MNRSLVSLLVLLFFIVCVVRPVRADDPPKTESSSPNQPTLKSTETDLERMILNQELDLSTRAKAVRLLFSNLTVNELRRLSEERSNSDFVGFLPLFASWEIQKRCLEGELLSGNADEIKVKPDFVESFCKQITQLTGVEPPTTWRRMLCESKWTSHGVHLMFYTFSLIPDEAVTVFQRDQEIEVVLDGSRVRVEGLGNDIETSEVAVSRSGDRYAIAVPEGYSRNINLVISSDMNGMPARPCLLIATDWLGVPVATIWIESAFSENNTVVLFYATFRSIGVVEVDLAPKCRVRRHFCSATPSLVPTKW